VIAVLASRLDPEARALCATWSAAGASLLSAEDLGRAGWVFRPGHAAEGVAVVAGQRVRATELSAVLTRRPAVLAEELGGIAPADRAYVAAETNAFLVAWLGALPCRVVNRPTPTSLCGPAWTALHWQAAARRAGIAWATADDEAAEPHEVVICGAHCLFAKTAGEAMSAQTLARVAGVDLLSVRFRDGRVCGASVSPGLADGDVQTCLLGHLLGRA
jgi:hypothetical protein